MSQILYELKIPVKITIDDSNISVSDKPRPYYLMVRRVHFIEFYFQEIHNYFSNFINSTLKDENITVFFNDSKLPK